MPNGSLIGGTKKDLNEAIQWKHAMELKQKRDAGIEWRCTICGGEDPFSYNTHNNPTEDVRQRIRLGMLIDRECRRSIDDARRHYESMGNQKFADDAARKRYLQEFHRLQVKALKDIVSILRLPYEDQIANIESKERDPNIIQTRILRCFSRRLRRALPATLKLMTIHGFIKPSKEQEEFSDDMLPMNSFNI